MTTPGRPCRCHRLLSSLAITLVVWAVLSWPLPRHLFSAIPTSVYNPEIRAMVPGDHLQLLYHFWLVEDMLRGNTPWFHNLYEFNRGSDADRFSPDPFFMPFSLLFAAASALGGRAFGWNLTAFITFWLTAWATWRAMRRWTSSEWIAAAAAVVSITFPYRWSTQLGGSPTGLAMLWPPLVFLGIDMAVRDRQLKGGALAGLAIALSAITDTHVYFFTVLALPLFALLVALHAPDFPWRRWRGLAGTAVALLPIPAFLGATLFLKHGGEAGTQLHGRSMQEVALYSAQWRDFFTHNDGGATSHIFIGILLPVACLLGIPALLLRRRPGAGEPPSRPLHTALPYAVVLAAIGLTLILALGPNSPGHGAVFSAARQFVPPYNMIRQPAKILCLMPLLAGLALVLSANALRLSASRLERPAVVILGVLLLISCRRDMQVGLSGLDREQGTYAAVAADAAARSEIPRVVVLPLWPGNSHYASVYQHYVSLYRIRMLNGYRPFVPADYGTEIFAPFSPLNAGIATDDMLDALQAMGIHYILLHENLYPEKVSPFTVNTTLNLFDANPRLQALSHVGEVWAWRILPAALPNAPRPASTSFAAPGVTRIWELESFADDGATPGADAGASGGRLLRLAPGNSATRLTRGEQTPILPGLRWMLRARGTGSVDLVTWRDGSAVATNPIPFAADDWTWSGVPLATNRDPRVPLQLTVVGTAGTIEADLLLLAAGAWPDAAALDAGISLPAREFFHAGYSHADDGGVTLLQARERSGPVFYGPKWPLPRGRYAASLALSTPSTTGTLGEFSVWSRAGGPAADTVVHAGGTARLEWQQQENLPVNLVFTYFGTADVTIDRVDIQRIGE